MKILIIRNYPSYMDVEKNTYNIQEVGLAKALVRRVMFVILFFGRTRMKKKLLSPLMTEEK